MSDDARDVLRDDAIAALRTLLIGRRELIRVRVDVARAFFLTARTGRQGVTSNRFLRAGDWLGGVSDGPHRHGFGLGQPEDGARARHSWRWMHLGAMTELLWGVTPWRGRDVMSMAIQTV